MVVRLLFSRSVGDRSRRGARADRGAAGRYCHPCAPRTSDRKAVETYVANISVRSDGQLARFHQPVCPVVIGLPPDHAAIVERRILADAAAAGAPVAEEGEMLANLIVIIAVNGRDLVKEIRVNRPGWLDGLTPRGSRRADRRPAPARAWSITSLRNEDGEGIGRPRGGAQRDPLGDAPVFRVLSASIIRQPTRQDVEASFVVIDQRIDGRPDAAPDRRLRGDARVGAHPAAGAGWCDRHDPVAVRWRRRRRRGN